VLAETTGHASVTKIAGAVMVVQVAEAALETSTAVQMSLPVAVNVVVCAQALAGRVEIPVKLATAPGAIVAAVKTTVLGTGRSLTTTTLLKVISPVFRTVPLLVIELPGTIGVIGQATVTAICGVVRMVQVELAELVTATPQILRAVPVEVLVIEQLVVAKKLPLKLLLAPGASVAAVKIGVEPLRLLRTITLVSVMLPEFLTEPL